jgi:hypothetical protein
MAQPSSTGTSVPASEPKLLIAATVSTADAQFEQGWQRMVAVRQLTVHMLCHGLPTWPEIDRIAQRMEAGLRRRFPRQLASRAEQALQAELVAYHVPGADQADQCPLCRDGVHNIDVLSAWRGAAAG